MTADVPMVSIPDYMARDIAVWHRDQAISMDMEGRTEGASWHREVADRLDPPPPRPQVGEHIRIVAEGVVTAYDPGSDAVQLDHEECWWPYSDAGSSVRYETRDPQPEPPSLREQVREVMAVLDKQFITWEEHAVGVIDAVANWLAAHKPPPEPTFSSASWQQGYDRAVELLRSGGTP